MQSQTKIILGIAVVSAVSYLLWKQFSNKKSLVGLPPIKYEFKNFSHSPDIIVKKQKSLPKFGVPIRIKKI